MRRKLRRIRDVSGTGARCNGSYGVLVFAIAKILKLFAERRHCNQIRVRAEGSPLTPSKLRIALRQGHG